ncbi:MAG: hypothetical protein NG737_00005 [Omnitrophica bacterium]|nr:hypothetical protein [Candidatus Omnitrophota bacterium]
MKTIKILIIFVFILLPSLAYSKSVYRNPFASLIPTDRPKPAGKKREVELPSLSIEGVLWGNDKPQTIIDGEVYSVGDKLKGLEAKVFRIEKNVVFISYGDKIYEEKISKKEGKR